MIDRGDNTYGGKYVVNPSGGLISKGHPLGATGLAQCTELSWQLRGLAGRRQVSGARLALQHNIGLGGAVIVALYRLGFPEQAARKKWACKILLHITIYVLLSSSVVCAVNYDHDTPKRACWQLHWCTVSLPHSIPLFNSQISMVRTSGTNTGGEPKSAAVFKLLEDSLVKVWWLKLVLAKIEALCCLSSCRKVLLLWRRWRAVTCSKWLHQTEKNMSGWWIWRVGMALWRKELVSIPKP